MTPAQIEKEVLIEAPIEVVWSVVTEPAQMQQWFCEEAELDARAGGAGRLRFKSGQRYFLQVEAFDPPRRFAYRWLQEMGVKAGPENSMLVEFTLQAVAGGTRLRVVESGFDRIDWTDEAKSRYADDHSQGWQHFVELLRDHAPRAITKARE
jgi:uncharacterized protein YndB with AHSA1/START domain